MTDTTRRLQREEEVVLQRLNRLNEAGSRRVSDLLQQMKEAETLRLTLRQHYPHEFDSSKHEFTDPKREGLHADFLHLVRKINDGLSRYQWSPTISQSTDLFDGLSEGFDLPKTPRAEYLENFAILWFWKHMRDKDKYPAPILRFRQCRECEQWFYAAKDQQKHCSDRCRKRFSTKSPDFKEKRARYMREDYRPKQKDAEKRGVVFKSKRSA
jgi:hypothetical protein